MATVTKASFPAIAAAAAILASNDAVAKPSKRWRDLAALRALPRALMGGTEAMREAGRQFCPQHPAELDTSYNLRINSTTLYNGFAETVTTQAGKFFGEPIVLTDTVPPVLVKLAENIDGQGRALTPFIADGTKQAFVDGISFILVDYPKVSNGATMADQIAQKARPYWVLIIADNLIGWRTTNVNGQQILTQVRIRECFWEDDGEYGEREVERMRVLEPGSWKLYEHRVVGKDARQKEWVLTDEGQTSLGYIPLVPIYTNRVGYMEGAPPLRTLAELNQEHWISSSEQRRALSFLRFAMLAVIGVDPDTDIVVAPDKVITLPNGSSVHYVEHSGAGIAAGASDLQDIERRMQSSGMELRVENSGSVTATAAAIDSAETNAGLKAVAKAIEDAIESALQITAEILHLQSGGEVVVNDDFGNTQVPGTVMELSALRNSQNLSQTTLWKELKRRSVLDEDFNANAEQVLLDGEAAQTLEHQQTTLEMQMQTANENAPPDKQTGP